MSQLRALYGARANTFIANAGVLQCFGVNDYETAKSLSQLMGQMTMAYTTTSHGTDDRFSTTHTLTGRDLLTPDEIMQLPERVQLLRLQGEVAQPVVVGDRERHALGDEPLAELAVAASDREHERLRRVRLAPRLPQPAQVVG